MSFIFVSKLRHLMKQGEDEEIQNVIYKVFTLFFTSVIITFISMTSYQIYISSEIGWMIYIVRILSIFDVVTNQISITLTLKEFYATYSKLCGCQERLCRFCCTLSCASTHSITNKDGGSSLEIDKNDETTTSEVSVVETEIEIKATGPQPKTTNEVNKPNLVGVNSNSKVISI